MSPEDSTPLFVSGVCAIILTPLSFLGMLKIADAFPDYVPPPIPFAEREDYFDVSETGSAKDEEEWARAGERFGIMMGIVPQSSIAPTSIHEAVAMSGSGTYYRDPCRSCGPPRNYYPESDSDDRPVNDGIRRRSDGTPCTYDAYGLDFDDDGCDDRLSTSDGTSVVGWTDIAGVYHSLSYSTYVVIH